MVSVAVCPKTMFSKSDTDQFRDLSAFSCASSITSLGKLDPKSFVTFKTSPYFLPSALYYISSAIPFKC